MKISRGDITSTEAAEKEIKLLKDCDEAGHGESAARQFVIKLQDNFTISLPRGCHQCVVMDLHGDSLLKYLPRNSREMYLGNVKVVMKQLLEGLHFLHHNVKIIHTDIKPENILLANTSSLQDLSQFQPQLKMKIIDLGNCVSLNDTETCFPDMIGTRQYRAPEVLLGLPYHTKVDVWSTACVAFEMKTGDYLFCPEGSPSSRSAHVDYIKDKDQLCRIMKRLGPLPSSLCSGGNTERYREMKSIFTQQGLDQESLYKVLRLEYNLEETPAKEFSKFLLEMLHLDPEKRVTAQEAAEHSFLDVTEREPSGMRGNIVSLEVENLHPAVKSKTSEEDNNQISLDSMLAPNQPSPLFVSKLKDRKGKVLQKETTDLGTEKLHSVIRNIVRKRNGGISIKRIRHMIRCQYPDICGDKFLTRLRNVLTWEIASGRFVQVTGRGINGSVKSVWKDGRGLRRSERLLEVVSIKYIQEHLGLCLLKRSGRELGHDLTLDKEGEDSVVMTETGGVTSLTDTRHTIVEGDDLLCTRVEIPERMNDVRDEFWS